MTHVCGHVIYVFGTWLIIMSHGSCACDSIGAHDSLYGLWDIAQLTRRSQLMDFTLWLTMSHGSRDARVWVLQGYGWGKNPYISAPSGQEIWVTNHLLYRLSDWNLNTMRIYPQYPPPPHSLWAAPLPSRLTSLIMSLGPGVLVSTGRLALLPPLSTHISLPYLVLGRSATPSRPRYWWLGLHFAVGENLSTGYGRFLRSLHLR